MGKDTRTMPKETVIESFTLDHDKVIAPYVRTIDQSVGPKGDVISNFDVRLTQPNEEFIDTDAMHTLEHLFAKYLRPPLEGYIDCSPYGCRTGFHLFVWGELSATEAAQAVKHALEQIVDTTIDQVPGLARKECGNYRDHNLEKAIAWAKRVLGQGVSDNAFERHLV